jgi:hypothetical protein
VAEYPDAQVDPALPLVYNQAFRFDTPGSGWLALNPVLGRELGWSCAAGDGLFRWRAASGEIVVETIGWADGFVHLPPPHFEEEVGIGWIVRIREDALGKLVARTGSLATVTRVTREREKEVSFHATEWPGGTA